ncbi:hypothetical protein OOK29_10060 [Streptomyces phaeochromogenes]|uniref:hypothetical protein n=1 Tax=Streptomyces phaeochromogenes TaxID=1923 RepID=UPI002258AE72|nr:hypothetical protein [Streptomyces phaeochromogenes]MCX5598483.1 hypothetical protein [Streptomyces phaeochromogenes]
MDWGTAPAWVAVVVAIAAATFSGLSWRASRKSAAAATRSADASTRSANTAAESLEFQRQKELPKVDLRIEPARGSGVYQLANRGGAAALDLSIVAEDASHVQWVDPLDDVLNPGEVREFVPSAGANLPPSLRFTWQGQDEPKYLSMP